MIEPLSSPFTDVFADLRRGISRSCLICSPYITQPPVRALVKSLAERGLQDMVQVSVLTDVSLPNIVGGATDLSALLYLYDSLAHVQVTYLPRLHAKVFIADGETAVVGSANFTEGGASRNYEYGIRISDAPLVQRIHDDLSHYASLGGLAAAPQLRLLQAEIKPLEEAARKAQKELRQSAPKVLQEQERTAQDSLVRLRVAGRSVNALFSDTILYLLARRSMTTDELNSHIQQIHPDLCDDDIDRVIDGKHYGKK